jgi:hypothetical protein
MTAHCEVYLAKEGRRPSAKSYLSLEATKEIMSELGVKRHPICGLETVPVLNRPMARNKSVDGYRDADLAFVRLDETTAKSLGRKAGWYPVEIAAVKKLKALAK